MRIQIMQKICSCQICFIVVLLTTAVISVSTVLSVLSAPVKKTSHPKVENQIVLCEKKKHPRQKKKIKIPAPCVHTTLDCLDCLLIKIKKHKKSVCRELTRIYDILFLLYSPYHCYIHCPLSNNSRLNKIIEKPEELKNKSTKNSKNSLTNQILRALFKNFLHFAKTYKANKGFIKMLLSLYERLKVHECKGAKCEVIPRSFTKQLNSFFSLGRLQLSRSSKDSVEINFSIPGTEFEKNFRNRESLNRKDRQCFDTALRRKKNGLRLRKTQETLHSIFGSNFKDIVCFPGGKRKTLRYVCRLSFDQMDLISMRIKYTRYLHISIFHNISMAAENILVRPVLISKLEEDFYKKYEKNRRYFVENFNQIFKEQRKFDFDRYEIPFTKNVYYEVKDASKQNDGEFFWGKMSIKGRRPTMEDEFSIVENYGSYLPEDLRDNNTFIGIYDGHGGRAASNFCKHYLHINTAYYASRNFDMAESLRRAHSYTESKFIKGALGVKYINTSGSTSISLILNAKESKCVIANLGDSRAIICRNGVISDLTSDHTPFKKKERERIKQDGGFIYGGRVGGHLAVARAFGDLNRATWKKLSGLSAKPDVMEIELGENFDFLLVACDGFWELRSSESIGREARRELRTCMCPQKALEKLTQHMYTNCHATDNLTAVLLTQKKTDKDSGEKYFVEKPRKKRSFVWDTDKTAIKPF